MIGSPSTADNRIFLYEVAGLRQTPQTTNNSYQIRTSTNIFLQVPYSRMNEQMQSINRLGGTIVSIHPFDRDMPKDLPESKSTEHKEND